MTLQTVGGFRLYLCYYNIIWLISWFFALKSRGKTGSVFLQTRAKLRLFRAILCQKAWLSVTDGLFLIKQHVVRTILSDISQIPSLEISFSSLAILFSSHAILMKSDKTDLIFDENGIFVPKGSKNNAQRIAYFPKTFSEFGFGR